MVKVVHIRQLLWYGWISSHHVIMALFMLVRIKGGTKVVKITGEVGHQLVSIPAHNAQTTSA